MEETISFKEIIKTLKKRILLIISITLAALILSAIYTFFIATPQYQASTQILVNQTQNNDQPITANELQSNREIINTYNVIITSPIILDQVVEELNLDRSISSLQSQITVSAEGDSQVVTLNVEDSDPILASELANTVAEVFEQEVIDIMNIDNVSILAQSETAEDMNPVSPEPILNLFLAFFIGLMISVGVAFLLEFLDQSVRSEQDVENILGLPILGSIAYIDENEGKFNNSQTRSDRTQGGKFDKTHKNKKTS